MRIRETTEDDFFHSINGAIVSGGHASEHGAFEFFGFPLEPDVGYTRTVNGEKKYFLIEYGKNT